MLSSSWPGDLLPWRGAAAARALLCRIADGAAGIDISDRQDAEEPRADREAEAAWFRQNDLAAPAYAFARRLDPALAGLLRRDALGGAAATTARLTALDDLERRFAGEQIPLVLLKGAAVACWAYADPSLRTMTDLDLWVRDKDMERASRILVESGYRPDGEKGSRPEELQRRSGGERIFRREGRPGDVVELHYSPFQGWWTVRAAAPAAGEAWRRTEPAGPGRHARRLASEDAVLQIVTHTVVNRFSQSPMRALLDVAVASRRRTIDWPAFARRAEAWRLRAASWLVLDAADRLFGVPGADEALSCLRPSSARRIAMRVLLASTSPLLLVALADDARGACRLVGRTLWPERWWLTARYGSGASRSRHLRELLRSGEV